MKFEQFGKLFLLFLAKTTAADLRSISGDIQLNILALFEVSVRIRAQQVGHAFPFSLLCYERVLSEEFSCAVEGTEFVEADLHPDGLLDVFCQSLVICDFVQVAVEFTKPLMAVDTIRIDEICSLNEFVFEVFPTDGRVFFKF